AGLGDRPIRGSGAATTGSAALRRPACACPGGSAAAASPGRHGARRELPRRRPPRPVAETDDRGGDPPELVVAEEGVLPERRLFHPGENGIDPGIIARDLDADRAKAKGDGIAAVSLADDHVSLGLPHHL